MHSKFMKVKRDFCFGSLFLCLTQKREILMEIRCNYWSPRSPFPNWLCLFHRKAVKLLMFRRGEITWQSSWRSQGISWDASKHLPENLFWKLCLKVKSHLPISLLCVATSPMCHQNKEKDSRIFVSLGLRGTCAEWTPFKQQSTLTCSFLGKKSIRVCAQTTNFYPLKTCNLLGNVWLPCTEFPDNLCDEQRKCETGWGDGNDKIWMKTFAKLWE